MEEIKIESLTRYTERTLTVNIHQLLRLLKYTGQDHLELVYDDLPVIFALDQEEIKGLIDYYSLYKYVVTVSNHIKHNHTKLEIENVIEKEF